MNERPNARIRVGALAGTLGPIFFLTTAFSMAAMRPDVIRAQGWVSWPSSMAIGGWVGSPQIVAFLALAACYPVFALRALRPTLARGWRPFLVIALGELLLAFPTDARGDGTSWHGRLHLAGVLIVTVATAWAAVEISWATWTRPGWVLWRWVGMPSIAVGVVVGALAGFHSGWAKIGFVLAVTLPIPMLAQLVEREAEGS